MSVRSPGSRSISLLLFERRVSGAAIMGVLSTALLFVWSVSRILCLGSRDLNCASISGAHPQCGW
jgi:hypothetical protein